MYCCFPLDHGLTVLVLLYMCTEIEQLSKWMVDGGWWMVGVSSLTVGIRGYRKARGEG